MEEEYNVAFMYTEKAYPYGGLVVWTTYRNKEDFKKRYEINEKEIILAENISDGDCISLVKSAEHFKYKENCTDPKTRLENIVKIIKNK